MTNIDPEKFIAELNKLKMTPEERKLADAEEIGKQIGELIESIIILLFVSTTIWAILTFIFALNISWAKVFGAYFLFNLIKNIIVNSFKR